MAQHARLSASSSERWMNCAGSVRMSEGMPNPTSDYALEGSAAHDIAARCLVSGADAETFVGLTVEVKDDEGLRHPVIVSEEMAEAVQVYLDHVRNILATLPKGANFRVEQRFSLEKLNPPEPMFGTADFCSYNRHLDHLDVVDYKHGEGVAVDAEENSQLMYYALGAVVAMGHPVKSIRITIVQPRGRHPDGIIRSFEFSWAELVAFKQVLFEKARRTQDPDAPLNPGEHCRFCPAAPVCPALHEMTTEIVQADFAVVEVEEEPQLPAPEVLSDERIAIVLKRQHLVKDWLRAVESYVHDRLLSGQDFPGFKLVEKRKTRRWIDEDAVVAWGEREEVDVFVPKLLSPAQVEKVLKGLGRSKSDLPEELVESKSSGYNVREESDPKPAAQITTIDEAFAGVLPAAEATHNGSEEEA